jgi:hypothetical protein
MKSARATAGAALVMAAALAGPVRAQGVASPAGDRVYVGAAGGFSFYDLPCQRYSDCDRNAAAARAAFGVVVVPGLAVEALGLHLGTTRSREAGIDVDTRVVLAGVGAVTLLDYGGGVFGSARLGLGGVRTRTQRISVPGGTPVPSDASWQPALYAGISIGLRLASALAIELHYDATTADYAYRDGRADALTLGLSLRF